MSWEAQAARFLSRWYVFVPLIILLSLLIYGTCLDDFPIPETFAHMSPFSLAALVDQVWNGLWNFCRPTAMIIFRIGTALFESNYVGYRFMLLALHLLNVFMVFALARVLFRNEMAAVVSGLIFATHPIHSECICLIVSLFDVSCMTFFLASLLAFDRYLVARESGSRAQARAWLLVTCLLLMLCLGSKEVGATLPFVMIAYDACTRIRRDRLKESVIAVGRRAIPFLLILAAYIIFRIARYEQNVSYVRLFFDDPLGTLRNLIDYFRLAFFPNEMWVVLLLMLPFAKKQYVFALVFLLLPLLPPLQIVPQERFVYISSAGYSMAVAWCFVIGWRRIGNLLGALKRYSRIASIGSAVAIFIAVFQMPFAYMNTLTWSEFVPIRKTLSSIWRVVGRPEPGTVLYFANIEPQQNLALLSEYDPRITGAFRCEKLINYLFENHDGQEFFFEIRGKEAFPSEDLRSKCKELEARLGRMSYGQPDFIWGPGGRPLSEWAVLGADPGFRPAVDEQGIGGAVERIETRICGDEPVVLLSPILDISTVDVTSVALDLDVLSEGTTCQLEWTLLPDGERRSNPASVIGVYHDVEDPTGPLSSGRWRQAAPRVSVGMDLTTMDLGSRPDWVFEPRKVERIAIKLTGNSRLSVFSIKLERPLKTRAPGLQAILQFHEK